jgi:cellulose synthase (UDP-forming)
VENPEEGGDHQQWGAGFGCCEQRAPWDGGSMEWYRRFTRGEHLKLRLTLARVLLAAAVILGARYFWWRLTRTIHPRNPLFSYVELALEAAVFVLFVIGGIPTFLRGMPVPHEDASVTGTIDILVPTVNEPIEVLEATIAGCKAAGHGARIYLLDDGRR